MTTLIVDALLIVVMLVVLDWRESRWAPRESLLRSAARTQTGIWSMRGPAPMPWRHAAPVVCDAARRGTATATDRKAS